LQGGTIVLVVVVVLVVGCCICGSIEIFRNLFNFYPGELARVEETAGDENDDDDEDDCSSLRDLLLPFSFSLARITG
jgi:hypothetical protein